VSGALSPAQAALLAARLKGRSPGPGTGPPEPATDGGSAPVSAEQEQLLAHALFLPGSHLYNEAVCVVRTGPVDLDALRRAVDLLVARHDIWHTTFQRQRREFRQVVGPAPTHPLPLHDLARVPAGQQEKRIVDLVTAVAAAPFNLRAGPLVRPVLVRVAPEEHRLYLALHHIVFDGVSLYRVVFPELVALYDAVAAGRVPTLPPTVQYADYARWQRSGVLDEELRRCLPHWRVHLADAPVLQLPLDHPRPAEQRHSGRMIGFEVGAGSVDAARVLAQATGTTLFHVLAAVFARFLGELTGQRDVVFATVADLRRRRELESMVGYCLTPVVLRVPLREAEAANSLVARVRDEVLDALSHLVPLERLVRELHPPRVPGADPLFQAMLVLEPPAVPVAPGWSMHQLDPAVGAALGQAKTDLLMELDERPDGRLSGRLTVNADLFGPGFAEQVVASWTQLLAAFTRTDPAP